MKRVAERAWLLEWKDEDERLANRHARTARFELTRRRPEGLVDAVPAARSLLVTGTAAFDPRALDGLEDLAQGNDGEPGRTHEVRVDLRAGVDVREVLARTGLSEGALAGLLEGAVLTVGFLGFLPGFAYLYGLPGQLHLPRRSAPRLAVPAGSFAIAGPYAAVYPRESPGGWNLLGAAETSAPLFEPAKDPPGLFAPGDSVRLVVARS